MRTVIIVALLLLASHARPDELQDRIVSAVTAYSELTPDYQDIAIGWVQTLVNDAVKQANPSEIVPSSAIGSWVARNQPVDSDPALRAQRVEWLTSVLTIKTSSLPVQPVSAAELGLRLTAAVDQVMPGPSKAEIEAQSVIAGKHLREDMEEAYKRRQERAAR